MKILVVDDDQPTRRLLRILLTNRQHQVFEASHGQAGWEVLRREAVQCVIVDWMMPIVDGPELVRRIRMADFPAYTYVIMLTARNTKEDVVNGLDGGADDYVTKPFNPEELRARVTIAERIVDLETRLREANQRLAVMAAHDSLTGLLNRRGLYEWAEKEMARAIREKSPVSLILMDLDHFKMVNDDYGYIIGDQALCLAANLIARNKRTYDTAGRWGGEEFMVVLPGADEVEAVAVADRLRAEITSAGLNLGEGKELRLALSTGVASMEGDNPMPFDKLIKAADEALYAAKRAGGNRVVAYSQKNT